MGFDWIAYNAGRIGELTLAHLWMTLTPTLIGLVIALPVGWVAYRYRRLYPWIVGVGGLLYTLPSLAVFIILPMMVGTQILDPINVLIALTVYTFALLVRSVADGLASVSPETNQAAEAMGYSSMQRFVRVQLPVATPVIMASMRVILVTNVSIVSMAAVIGVPQLGSLFTEGFSRRQTLPIIVGIVVCLILAIILDQLVVRASKWLTPWLPKERA
ncbi:ABC transporter permease [Agrococcus casei]|uniref:L-proline glycine betaine ABC transport system permease protein ProW (TC 3.A.1.12.1) n=1 Tax=Agrococcus casei LMG 22410 TaxID=1255656 RepID=A0A1R4FAU3_9MICO|nr:ABC transporter permease [Agrococcus casei]SJM52953.1 L-proline glycine betaine ABC transport system permease protein ProW (TC 3.A.1.12.1) [Agrococcus casei LMG 22410]